jgi:hypothetical protein
LARLAKYLQLIGPLPEGSMFPNECRPYLAGVVGRGAQLKFLLRAGMLPLGRLMESKKRRRGAASCPACGGPEEDATHFVFTSQQAQQGSVQGLIIHQLTKRTRGDGIQPAVQLVPHRSVFGCACRLAQWPALRGVLGTRSALIVIRGGAQVVCMVQCRMCVRWYHRSCGGGSQASAVDWVCKACDVVVSYPSFTRVTRWSPTA